MIYKNILTSCLGWNFNLSNELSTERKNGKTEKLILLCTFCFGNLLFPNVPWIYFWKFFGKFKEKLVFWEIPWMLRFVCRRSIECLVNNSFIDILFFFLYYSLFLQFSMYMLLSDAWHFKPLLVPYVSIGYNRCMC